MAPDIPTSGVMATLYNSAIGTAIRESSILFPTIESLHVLMIVTVVGTIAIVDLRLMGIAAHRRGARQLIIDMLPFTWVAFALAALTGALLFVSNATGYYQSTPFRLKMLVILIAGINMGIFHVTAYRRIGHWDDLLPTPRAVRFAGFSSLTLWILVVFLGRWIGYSYPIS
jgi:hypothetical protein